MRTIYFIGVLLLVFTIQFANSQSKNGTNTDVEQMPEFPGGEKGLMAFINQNLKYPAIAQEMGIQGRVVVRFLVTRTGTIDSIEVSRSVDKSLDDEALRIVKLLPKFVPGKINGKNASCWFSLPFSFAFEKEVNTQKGK